MSDHDQPTVPDMGDPFSFDAVMARRKKMAGVDQEVAVADRLAAIEARLAAIEKNLEAIRLAMNDALQCFGA